MVSFSAQKCLILMKSVDLLFLVLLVSHPRNSIMIQGHKDLGLFSSESLTASVLTFRPLVHCGLTCRHGEVVASGFETCTFPCHGPPSGDTLPPVTFHFYMLQTPQHIVQFLFKQ